MKFYTIVKSGLLLLTFFFAAGVATAQPEDPSKDPQKLSETILHLDSLFWQAYNACDVEKMESFFTEDLEFYHDKGGLTTPRASLVESTRTGLCGNENWRLRREAVEGTVKVYPLNNYGALISGEHVFYINEKGRKEYLDGLAKFTQLWQYKNNEWKMSRVLSYDHRPAPYKNQRKEVTLTAPALQQFNGQYASEKTGAMTVTPEGNTLKLSAGDFKVTLYPESEKLFFVKERDLQFEFVRDDKNKVVKMIVHEKGAVVEEVKKIKQDDK